MIPLLRQILRVGIVTEPAPDADDALRVTQQRLSETMRKQLGRALVIRHVDAGSCNGCELEIHALGNPYYNLEALGIKFAASPRHADLLLVTGPVAKNMQLRSSAPMTPHPTPSWLSPLATAAVPAVSSARVTPRAGASPTSFLSMSKSPAARRRRCN